MRTVIDVPSDLQKGPGVCYSNYGAPAVIVKRHSLWHSEQAESTLTSSGVASEQPPEGLAEGLEFWRLLRCGIGNQAPFKFLTVPRLCAPGYTHPAVNLQT